LISSITRMKFIIFCLFFHFLSFKLEKLDKLYKIDSKKYLQSNFTKQFQ
jgi:hypothetical protein